MPKLHPVELDGLRGLSPKDVDEIVQDHIQLTYADDNNRTGWMERQYIWEDRRYCRADRHTNWPWPGASDLVMPVEDAKIEETKAVLVRTTFGPQIADFVTHNSDPSLHEQKIYDSLFMNWLLRYGMKDFEDQITIAFDQLLQTGIGVLKTFWDFRKHNVKRVFRRRDFLSRYPELIDKLTTFGTRAAFANQPMQVIGGGVSSSDIANRIYESMKPLIIRDCGLDLSEKRDADALDKIMSGLRDGKDFIEYKTVEVISNIPRTIAVDHADFIVPTNSTFNYQQRKTHRLWLSEETLLQRAEERGWSKKAVDIVLDSSNTRRGKESGAVMSISRFNEMKRDQREGVMSFGHDGMYEVWESHWHMKTAKDGVVPVWAIIHPSTGTLLKDIHPEPYDHGQDPFDFMTFERNTARFYSPRGLPEKLDDLSWTITLRHRAKLNNMDMLVPAFTKKVGSFLEAGDVNYIPGEMYDVTDHDALRPIPVPNYTATEEREELIMRGWIESYVGGLDIISSQQSIHEARTAREIDALQAATRDVLAYRIFLAHRGFNRALDKIWDLCNQWLPAEIYQNVTGRPFKRKSREEIRNDYSIVAVGKLETTDPIAMKQNALMRLQMLLQVIQANGGPDLGEFKIDIGAAIRMWLMADNALEAPQIMQQIPPEVRQQREQEANRMRQLGQALDANVPVSMDDVKEIVNKFGKNAPHGKRQRIRA